MPEERTLPISQSADLPTFKILSENNQLSEEYHVMSIIVSKSVNKISYAKIILKDGNPSTEDFPLSNQDFFIPGKSIEIQAGYHGEVETIFKGIVIKHAIKAINRKPSYLIIDCKDESVKLTIGRKNRYFSESTDSEIVEEILGNYTLRKDVESSTFQHKEMVQYYSTDWDFIVSRAEKNALVVIPDDGEIKIKKPEVESEAHLTLVYGATILDFEAEIDSRNQFSTVKSASWDYANQEIVETEGEDPGINQAGNLSETNLAHVIGLNELELKHSGQVLETELQAWSDAAMQKSILSKIRGRVRCQGFANVKPGNTLELSGVGDRFTGKVFVSGITHQIADNTWHTDIHFGMDPKWFSKSEDIIDTPSAGLVPGISGLQIGVVTQLQDDPDGEDRILVKLPIIDSNEEGIWARISTLDAGNNRGSFFRPEIDDEVIVGFINDDPRDPIVLGMLNSSAKPAPITASDDNHEKGFVTRSEIKVIFDDDKKSITIETPNGNVVTISDDDGGIKIEDENGNFIEMNADGITIESQSDINIKASGDINVEGTNITNSANAQFTAEGSGGAEVSSASTTVIQGGIVQIN